MTAAALSAIAPMSVTWVLSSVSWADPLEPQADNPDAENRHVNCIR